MRTRSDECKTSPLKCPACGTNWFTSKLLGLSRIKNFEIVDEQGQIVSFSFMSRFSTDSYYIVCKKCNHKISIFKPLESEFEIIKTDKLKSYSVADELLKWAKLKEDGHISEQEFDDARKKLLKRD